MPTLPPKDVVIIGLGWTGSMLAHRLAEAGLDVIACERGPWRDTAQDFPLISARTITATAYATSCSCARRG